VVSWRLLQALFLFCSARQGKECVLYIYILLYLTFLVALRAVIEFLVKAGANSEAHTNYSTKTAKQYMESEPDCMPCPLQ
jgi:hypothetical protein